MNSYSKLLLSLSLVFVSSCSTNVPNSIEIKGQKNLIDSRSNSNNSFATKYIPLTPDGYNEDAYLIAFTDVANIVKIPNNVYGLSSGYKHYLATKSAENRLSRTSYIQAKQSVDEGFNESVYLTAFPDIANAVANNNSSVPSGHWHYFNYGRSEGRLSTPEYVNAYNNAPIYIEEAYLMTFPNVRKSIKRKIIESGYVDYLVNGLAENRLMSSGYFQARQELKNGFNEIAYLLAFSDIANIVKDPNNIYGLTSGYHHYLNAGKNEGRLLNPSYIQAKQSVDAGFDEIAYLLAFSDIANIVKDPNNVYGLTSGYKHYVNSGKNEGRLLNPSYIQAKQAIDAGFNETAYLLAFSDIANIVKDPNNIYGLTSGYQHYINSGKNEGRLNSPQYFSALSLVLDGTNAGSTISFGGTQNTKSKYVEVTSSSNQATPGTSIDLTVKAFNNPGNQVLDSVSNDKWTWSVIPLSPFRGYIDYNGGNIAKFYGSGSAGTVTITAKSKITGEVSSITVNIPDVAPKVDSISPVDNTLTLPSSGDTVSNVVIPNGSGGVVLSVTFTDENKDWPIPSNLTTAYERNINLIGPGISINVPASNIDNYDMYVGGFTNSLSSHFISSTGYQISADKRSFTISPDLNAFGASSGYVVINSKQNGVTKRKHRFNIVSN